MEDKYPTNKIVSEVGAVVSKAKVKLPYYMGSMDKIKPDTGAIERWKSKYNGSYVYNGPYVLSAKLDGISALYCTNTDTPKLYTRGNGVEGRTLHTYYHI